MSRVMTILAFVVLFSTMAFAEEGANPGQQNNRNRLMNLINRLDILRLQQMELCVEAAQLGAKALLPPECQDVTGQNYPDADNQPTPPAGTSSTNQVCIPLSDGGTGCVTNVPGRPSVLKVCVPLNDGGVFCTE